MNPINSIKAHLLRKRFPHTALFICLFIVAAISSWCPRISQAAENPYSLWPSSARPSLVSDPDSAAVELGVKIRSSVAGHITGIRFYKGASNTGTHVGNLWSSNGTRLATATFTNETASGWQQVDFATPVAISADTLYVASYHTNTGHYSADEGYFSSSSVTNGPLEAVSSTVSANGVYLYGAGGFPNQTWNGSNYWVDVVFSADSGDTPSVPVDTTPPIVTEFSIPSTSGALSIPITAFSATDNVAVTGYMITESAAVPSASASGWSATVPASYAFTTEGSKTLYAWAKDAAGNVSSGIGASVGIAIADTSAPTVVSFTVPASATTLAISITEFVVSDNVGVTGYLISETSASPQPDAPGWVTTPPSSYTFATAGSKTLYAWARDAAGNVSASKSASVTITIDVTRPTVTSFLMPATASSLTVPITSFTATDNVAVTGYLVSESSATPSVNSGGWTALAPSSYTFAAAGTRTAYGWARDAAGNVSDARSASLNITLQSSGPEPAGWFAGDPHVHRSCGGSPESLSSLLQKMSINNLSVMSMLADMGNGEVQNPDTDLPLVNGSDASISTPDRIVHWDTEWHWDATYGQYEHQALGGHIVALGLSEAQQVWEEYTFPIFNWVHQRNGIAGFAHMQYLDDDIPQTLDCCKPLEYPVEFALGAADFISEDVEGGDSFIHAYYRLLNTGFRPGFAAGTDYPCGVDTPGSLLTYGQVAGGTLTYRNWIESIAQGRTVVSRNGHNEFLDLVVNSWANPGDEIRLDGASSLPVMVTWTAKQNYTGSIELVMNGEVVASMEASAGPDVPATLITTVDIPKSGWLAARRMGSGGHQLHTGAVYVIVDDRPIRASEEDAQFYVAWIDNLLQKTTASGVWGGFFSTSRDQARARYQQARAVFQQIASEAAGAATVPTVAAVSPIRDASGVATGAAVTVTFSEAMEPASISTNTFYLSDASGALVPAFVAYNSLTRTATLTPSLPLSFSTTYTAVVASEVQDLEGTPLGASYGWSFTTASEVQPNPYSLWPSSARPSLVSDPDSAAVELGVKIRSSVAGHITGIRFYKGASNTGTHVGNLWSSNGTRLATATFTNETASGWQQVDFATPVAISADTLYVASYHTNTGHYSADEGYFSSSSVTNGPLEAVSSTVSANGVYLYGAGGFPNQTWNGSNYWVDVVFVPDTP